MPNCKWLLKPEGKTNNRVLKKIGGRGVLLMDFVVILQTENRTMEPRLSEHAKQAIANSRDEAIRLKNGAIGVEHLFLGILREEGSSTVQILTQLNVDLAAVKSRIESLVGQMDSDIRYSMDSEIPMLRQTEKILRLSFLESSRLKSKEIHTIHMFLAMLQDGENTVAQVLKLSLRRFFISLVLSSLSR